jgi:hypothetical protein
MEVQFASHSLFGRGVGIKPKAKPCEGIDILRESRITESADDLRHGRLISLLPLGEGSGKRA